MFQRRRLQSFAPDPIEGAHGALIGRNIRRKVPGKETEIGKIKREMGRLRSLVPREYYVAQKKVVVFVVSTSAAVQ